MTQFIQQLIDACGGFPQFVVGLGLLILYLITTFLYGCAKSALAEAEQAAHRWKDREVELVSELKERDETIKNLIEDNQYLRTALDRAVKNRSGKFCAQCGAAKDFKDVGIDPGQEPPPTSPDCNINYVGCHFTGQPSFGQSGQWSPSAAEKKRIHNFYFPPDEVHVSDHTDQVIRLFKDDWIRNGRNGPIEVSSWAYVRDLNYWKFWIKNSSGPINFKLPNWLVLAGLIEDKFDHGEYRGCPLEGLAPHIILRADGRLAGPLIGRTNDGKMLFHKPADPATAKEMATWLGKYADSDGKLGAKFLTENDDICWRIAKSTDEKIMADYWLHCGNGESWNKPTSGKEVLLGGWSWPAPFWTNIQS